MSTKAKEVVLDKEVIEAELRAELEAQIRAEIKAESEAKIKEEAEKVAALEEKLKQQEASLELQIREEEKSIQQQLKEMEQVWLEIPEDPNNPDDVVPIGWNGVIYAVPRGQRFKVPVAIYDVWNDSYQRTKEVNKRVRESVKKEIKVL